MGVRSSSQPMLATFPEKAKRPKGRQDKATSALRTYSRPTKPDEYFSWRPFFHKTAFCLYLDTNQAERAGKHVIMRKQVSLLRKHFAFPETQYHFSRNKDLQSFSTHPKSHFSRLGLVGLFYSTTQNANILDVLDFPPFHFCVHFQDYNDYCLGFFFKGNRKLLFRGLVVSSLWLKDLLWKHGAMGSSPGSSNIDLIFPIGY